MRKDIPDVGHNLDNQLKPGEMGEAMVATLADILYSNFERAKWSQRAAGKDGELRKDAMLSLSRAALALQGGSEGIQTGLWPTVGNTRFLADRLPRLKVNFHHFEIESDGAIQSDAATREEGDDIVEQSLDLEPQEIYIRSISAYKTVTNETIEDHSGLRKMLIKSLLQSVLMRIDAQIISGDGTAPNVLGLRNWTGISSQSKASDATAVAIAKAAKLVYQAGYTPNLIILNPADWLDATTASGVNPFTVGNQLHGIDLFVSEAAPSGYPTVLDTSGVCFLERSPLNLMMSKTNDDDFIMGHVTLRAEQRVAIAVTDTASVCKVIA